jgi:hypothetical protein
VARDWKQLYQLQDWVLARLRLVAHGLYLSGGTALARGYCQHRYSEDLDFFTNDAPEFGLWRDRCLEALRRAAEPSGLRLEIILREERFGRAVLHGEVPLKLEFINDVPSRVGTPWEHPELGRLDTKENIFANKISALLDREEPKDVADIYWLCCREGLDVMEAIEHADGKAAGVFPPLVAERLSKALRAGVPKTFWIQEPESRRFASELQQVIQRILE